jgi:hypothetical protein
LAANIGTGLLAAGAILLLMGPWFTREVTTRAAGAGLILTAVGTVIAAYAISWVPVAIGVGSIAIGYLWLVRRAYRDRGALLCFLEDVKAYVVGPAWCLGLVGGADPYEPVNGYIYGRQEVAAEIRPIVIPTAQRQARLSWAIRNGAWLYIQARSTSARPRPFPPSGFG